MTRPRPRKHLANGWVLVRQCRWKPPYATNIHGTCGLLVNLTELTTDSGVTVYVRENIRFPGGGFAGCNSGVRAGLKKGTYEPPSSWQVLDLCAPAECWDDVAAEIRRLDGSMARPVRRVPGFTAGWAVREFELAGCEAGRCA